MPKDFPEGNAQREEMPGGKGCPEEEDAQMARMPGGQGCLEEVDAQRRRSPEETCGTPQRSGPPMEEQIPDDDTLAPTLGHSREDGRAFKLSTIW